MDTWIFLGALALATFGMLRVYGWAISGYHPPAPRDDLIATGRFVSMRGTETEIDLGQRWRSTDDPGAIWHVWWVAENGDLIGLRTGALPPPPGGVGHQMPQAMRAQMYVQLPYCGMKVLGHLDHRPASGMCDHIRALPNGLDVLCGGTRGDADLTN